MPRYKLTLEYDGTAFSGWQKQEHAPSVQAVVETALSHFYGHVPIEVFCAGRTDAGVHARGQVAHFDLPEAREPALIMRGINALMIPQPVAVLAVEEVDAEFHARFDAKKRHYLYRIVNRKGNLALDAHRALHVHKPLDVERMNAAAQHLLGHHDFTSFRSSDCQSKSPVKTLDTLEVVRRKERPEQIMIRTSAKSFLHHQVRNMVGTLIYVGMGKWEPERVKTALAAKDRREGGPMAEAHGLYLMKVEY